MKSIYRRSILLLFILLTACQVVALAAPAALNGVRFSSGAEHDRIVLDLSTLPAYKVTTANNGQRIVVDLGSVADTAAKPAMQSDFIQQVSFQKANGRLQMVIDLYAAATYRVQTLQNPTRLFVDINKTFETTTQQTPGPGLTHTTYVRKDGRGMLTAHFLEVDKNTYTVRQALSNGKIPGRETVSGISDENNAVAAINSSYFSLNGELIGITKIDGSVVGTTYFNRSAFGIMPDGTVIFGKGSYDGTVTVGKVSLPVAGVDCERGENNLTLYNSYYGATTNTNEFGEEYVVKNGRIAAIQQANTAIPAHGVVISAHGTAKDALAGVKVGDPVTIREELGTKWDQARQIVGAGPTLVENGQVHVTAAEEQFPADIASGRAPRTAVGVLKNGNFLFAVVDGRQDSSIGCTLTEWAALLKKFGAVNAINFDGGGSSEMVIGGQVINSPSDGSERKVGAALLVVKK